jgi:methionyl-tRNA formyltransferase
LFLCGTQDFALETLKEIYKSGHNILAVVSQPDKKVGRGMKVQMTPTKEFAVENEIKCFQPEKIRNNEEFINNIKALKPDIIVVVAYGKILPKELLDIPKYGCMNVHGSLLPKYRGAAPIQWAIINGEEVTGVTTMKMDVGMDTGDIYLTQEVEITKEDTYGSLYEKLKKVGAKLAIRTLDCIVEGSCKPKKQPEEFSVAPMIYKENCKINYMQSAFSIVNLIRGVNPMPGAWTTLDDETYKFWSAEEVEEDDFKDVKGDLAPGTILESDSKHGLFIATASGVLSVKEIQAPGAKRMNILDFLRGKKLEVGKIFK